ncbi:hypothetical protein BSLG_010229 [Batrachochytrium salamandrivorans]|nr:hypothetical protein BSLG_010229 [Batrachochytrium salamandrivorans]
MGENMYQSELHQNLCDELKAANEEIASLKTKVLKMEVRLREEEICRRYPELREHYTTLPGGEIVQSPFHENLPTPNRFLRMQPGSYGLPYANCNATLSGSVEVKHEMHPRESHNRLNTASPFISRKNTSLVDTDTDRHCPAPPNPSVPCLSFRAEADAVGSVASQSHGQFIGSATMANQPNTQNQDPISTSDPVELSETTLDCASLASPGGPQSSGLVDAHFEQEPLISLAPKHPQSESSGKAADPQDESLSSKPLLQCKKGIPETDPTVIKQQNQEYLATKESCISLNNLENDTSGMIQNESAISLLSLYCFEPPFGTPVNQSTRNSIQTTVKGVSNGIGSRLSTTGIRRSVVGEQPTRVYDPTTYQVKDTLGLLLPKEGGNIGSDSILPQNTPSLPRDDSSVPKLHTRKSTNEDKHGHQMNTYSAQIPRNNTTTGASASIRELGRLFRERLMREKTYPSFIPKPVRTNSVTSSSMPRSSTISRQSTCIPREIAIESVSVDSNTVANGDSMANHLSLSNSSRESAQHKRMSTSSSESHPRQHSLSCKQPAVLSGRSRHQRTQSTPVCSVVSRTSLQNSQAKGGVALPIRSQATPKSPKVSWNPSCEVEPPLPYRSISARKRGSTLSHSAQSLDTMNKADGLSAEYQPPSASCSGGQIFASDSRQ